MDRYTERATDRSACQPAQTGFCSRLDGDGLERFCASVQHRSYCEGEVIRAQDGLGTTALLVRHGVVKLVHHFSDGRRQIVDLLFPGDLLLGGGGDGLEDCFAEAGSDVRTCEVPMAALTELIGAGRPAGEAAMALAIGEVGRKNRQLLAIGRKRSEERLAGFLLDYAERSQPLSSRPCLCHLALTRSDIADFLCLTKETVSRCFTVLREAGLIRMSGSDDIEMSDRGGLERVARGDGPVRAR